LLYYSVDLRISNERSGELEFLGDSGWVPVCFTGAFNNYAADSACLQLGYQPFAAEFHSVSHSTSGIAITSSRCQRYTSPYLFSCVTYREMTCQTTYHLTCKNVYYYFTLSNILTLLGGPVIRLVGGPVEHMGRVEVYDRVSDRWGTICANDVGQMHNFGRIVCSMLGYGDDYFRRSYITGGNAGSYSNIHRSSNGPIIRGRFYCDYNERYLHNCQNFLSYLGYSQSRCTAEQELVLICRREYALCIPASDVFPTDS